MLKRPLFKRHFQVIPLEGDNAVYLFSETRSFVLKGRSYCLAASLMDGERSVDDIADLLEDEIPSAEIYYVFEMLEKKGYITEADSPFDRPTAAYWDLLGHRGEEAQQKLARSRVCVLKVGDVDTGELVNQLSLSGLTLVEAEDSTFTVIVADDYLRAELSEINQDFIKQKKPWMLLKPLGVELWLGPIFDPVTTGCYECLAQRVRANRDTSRLVLQHKGDAEHFVSSAASLPHTRQAAFSLAALEIVRWIVEGGNARLLGNVICHDTLAMTMEKQPLTKRPQCPACGEAEGIAHARAPQKVLLRSVKKSSATDGGHRAIPPEETYMKFRHHIGHIAGVVRRLTRGTPMESPAHVYLAGHNFALGRDYMLLGQYSIRSMSAGKGMSDMQAQVSALCEAMERYSGLYTGEEPRQPASYHQLGDRAVHPCHYMNFSDLQYENRMELNRRGHAFSYIPEPFDEDAEIDWTPVWNSTRDDWSYMPTSLCYYGYPYIESKGFGWADSNGSASGNTMEEAILQGFFEIIERDAVAIWWYNRLKRPEFDLDSLDHPYVSRLREYYRRNGRDFWVLDITSDFDVPAFTAVTRRLNYEREEIVFAFGAHFDAEVAVLRALCEMNQFIPSALDSDKDDGLEGCSDKAAVDWWKNAKLEQEEYLAPDRTVPMKTVNDYKNRSTNDFKEDIALCQKMVESKGMELLLLDQTRPDVGLSVVKVIVPGMRHMWQRTGPGRLYSTPVEMEWLTEQKQEHELNPTGIFV